VVLVICGSDRGYNRQHAMWKSEDSTEIEKIRKALLEYCKMDTIGMVRILEKLREIPWRNLGLSNI